MLGNMDHLDSDQLNIFMEYGTGNRRRFIDISQLYAKFGNSVCASLPGFHAVTGCDYNPSFFNKGKRRPFQLLMKNKLYQKAFIDLGCAHTTDLRNEVFNMLEKFVCEMYGVNNIADINIARFEKFCKTFKAKSTEEPFKKTVKNYDPSTLPPCKAELHQQLLRAQYVTSIWRNAHLRFPSNLVPTEHGWQLKEDKLDFYWFDGDCMPQLVIDAIDPGTFEHSDENATDNEEEFIELNSMDEFTSDEEIPSDIDE